MSTFDLSTFAEQLDANAKAYRIGALQRIRAALHGKRPPGHRIFTPQTINVKGGFAFHYGGRSELQYNIGIDGLNDTMLRYGVAFSFETSQSLPEIDVLIPKVKLFNDFLRLYPDLYADMRMWHWRKGNRSSDSPPGPILPELVSKGIFVFFGLMKPLEDVDPAVVLSAMDRLLPLYEYVESNGRTDPLPVPPSKQFVFRPGCRIKPIATKANLARRELDVLLRHNVMQLELYRQLVKQYGENNVGTEVENVNGTSIDVVVQRPDGFSFYEIKTFQSPRACIREALGQLLEYSYWPGSQQARRLVVVGETAPDEDVRAYCSRLNEQFSLPIEYQQLSPGVPAGFS